MRKLILTIAAFLLLFSVSHAEILYAEHFDHVHAETCPHFLVCGADSAENPFTQIVDLDDLEILAQENMICSAYVIYFDGVAEIDWCWNNGTFMISVG